MVTTVPFLRTSIPVTGAAVVETALSHEISTVPSPYVGTRPVIVAGAVNGRAVTEVDLRPSPALP